MNAITIILDFDERLALAGAIEAAMTATHKAVLGGTSRYFDEDAAAWVTYDRVDPVVVHTSILALEGLRPFYSALTTLLRKERPAAFGVVVSRTEDRGARIVVEKAYAAFTANLLSLAFQHALVLAPDVDAVVGDEYPAGSEQRNALTNRIRDERQMQRRVLKRAIEALS